ncbi:MAG: fliQ [Acidimicrobiia bacterium]|nr:fliQ [Acidimicrobiia bacterium]
MTDTMVLHIGLLAMLAAAKLAAPVLLTALFVGLAVGLLQSVTQIQEVTLTFVPKFAAVGLVLLLAGGWMLNELVAFSQSMFALIPEMISS